MSEDILAQLENQLKEIENNDNIENNENIQIREKTMEILYSLYPNMQYDKFIQDNHVFLNFWIPEWINTKTTIIFYFCDRNNNDTFIHHDNKGRILSMLSTELPFVTNKYRTICNYDDTYLKKKEEIKDFVEKTKDFVDRYSFMFNIFNKFNEKYKTRGKFNTCFDYETDKKGNIFFLGFIPNIGHFHFNLTYNKLIIFALEKGISKKVFNINSKKEDRIKWKELKGIEITPFIKITTELNDAFDIVYEKIEQSIEHAFTFC